MKGAGLQVLDPREGMQMSKAELDILKMESPRETLEKRKHP